MNNSNEEMSFLEHLEELRWHLLRSCMAILIFGTIAFLAKDFIFNTILFGPKQIDFIWGRSFPNPGGLFPYEPYQLTKEVYNIVFFMFPRFRWVLVTATRFTRSLAQFVTIITNRHVLRRLVA